MIGMTVKDLIYILKDLPAGMLIVIPFNESKFIPLCYEHAEIIDAERDGNYEKMLLLNPCHCETDAKDLIENLPLN